jgi:hypothetical protein
MQSLICALSKPYLLFQGYLKRRNYKAVRPTLEITRTTVEIANDVYRVALLLPHVWRHSLMLKQITTVTAVSFHKGQHGADCALAPALLHVGQPNERQNLLMDPRDLIDFVVDGYQAALKGVELELEAGDAEGQRRAHDAFRDSTLRVQELRRILQKENLHKFVTLLDAETRAIGGRSLPFAT